MGSLLFNWQAKYNYTQYGCKANEWEKNKGKKMWEMKI